MKKYILLAAKYEYTKVRKGKKERKKRKTRRRLISETQTAGELLCSMLKQQTLIVSTWEVRSLLFEFDGNHAKSSSHRLRF
jgi:hypothetical protein